MGKSKRKKLAADVYKNDPLMLARVDLLMRTVPPNVTATQLLYGLRQIGYRIVPAHSDPDHLTIEGLLHFNAPKFTLQPDALDTIRRAAPKAKPSCVSDGSYDALQRGALAAHAATVTRQSPTPPPLPASLPKDAVTPPPVPPKRPKHRPAAAGKRKPAAPGTSPITRDRS
jgi:hypothetical protein